MSYRTEHVEPDVAQALDLPVQSCSYARLALRPRLALFVARLRAQLHWAGGGESPAAPHYLLR